MFSGEMLRDVDGLVETRVRVGDRADLLKSGSGFDE